MGDRERSHVIPILLHGDAAFAGQGIVAETLNLAGLPGYSTGGTIHVVVNNQIGFTTLPEDARSSTYCTDVAKMVHAPVFHVNGDDPEAVVYVAGLAFEYRQRFKKDVVIDLVCYRRWGHNEGDEPSYTQPLMYAKIKSHTSVAQLYGEQLVRKGLMSREELDKLWADEEGGDAAGGRRGPAGRRSPSARRSSPPRRRRLAPCGRGCAPCCKVLSALPAGFEIHPKLAPLREEARGAARGQGRGGLGHRRVAGLRDRSCSRASPCGSPARTRGAAPSASATPSSTTPGRRRSTCPSTALAPAGRPLRGLRLPALRGRGHGLRVRLLGGRAPGPRDVGGPVRRLHERRPGDHRPVPRGQRDEVAPARGPHPAPAPRPRRPGARALERAHRALPDPVRRGQHARGLSLVARVLLPPAALAGARSRGEAARGLHPEEPAAPSALRLDACRSWPMAASSRCSTTAPSIRRRCAAW